MSLSKTNLPSLNSEVWPMKDILAKLTEAADILLNQFDYDGDGWEEILECKQKAVDYLESDKIVG